MRFHRALVLLVACLVCPTLAKGQVVDLREIGGKTVGCMHSGLFSDLNDCGPRSDWYSYVFVGTIHSVTPEGKEMRVEIVPKEIFFGQPETPVVVTTSQGLCLPALTVGQDWLFYLRKEKDKPSTLDYYGNDSLPVEKAQEQLQTLRQLSQIGNAGLLRGKAYSGSFSTREPIEHAPVLAIRKRDRKQFATTTLGDGRYEFPPLPPGKYKITVGNTGPLWPDSSEIEVKSGSCWDLTLAHKSKGEIKGRVTRPDGSPVVNMDVAMIDADNSGYLTTQTNREGRYSLGVSGSGEFVIGLNFPARADWINGGGSGSELKLPPASLFYPGSTQRSGASVIRVKEDETVEHIDFVVTAP